MKFKHHLVYDNSEDIGYMLEGGDYNLSCLVVDTTLENLKTKRKVIPIVSIYAHTQSLPFLINDCFSDRFILKTNSSLSAMSLAQVVAFIN